MTYYQKYRILYIQIETYSVKHNPLCLSHTCRAAGRDQNCVGLRSLAPCGVKPAGNRLRIERQDIGRYRRRPAKLMDDLLLMVGVRRRDS